MAQPTFYTESRDGSLYTEPGRQYVPTAPDSLIRREAPSAAEHGEIYKGIARGIDNLQAMGYGAVGAVADVAGNKTFAEKMYEGVQSNLAEAQKNPAAVAQFSDIGDKNGYAKDAWDWFWGAAAESLPSSVAALATSGAGALIFRAAATKLATDALTKKIVGSEIAGLVAKGATEQAAKQAVVKQFFANEIKQQAGKAAMAGAYAGGALSGSAMESGSNWNEDVQKYGIQNTSPGSDIAYGIGGGLIEAGLGPERQLIGKFAQEATKKELTDAAKRGVLKNLGLGIAKASGSEGAEEFGQQMLNQMSLARDPLTQQNWKDNFNAMAGGMAGGALFGVAGGTQDAMRGSAYKAAGGLNEPVKTDPTQPTPPPSKSLDDLTSLGVQSGVVRAQGLKQSVEIDQTIESLNATKSDMMSKIINVHNDTNMDPEQKDQAIKQYETAAMEATAQLSVLANKKTELQKSIESEVAKLDKKIVGATADNVTEKMLAARNEFTPEQSGKMAVAKGVAEQHANNEINKANARVSQHLAAIKAIEAANAADTAMGWGLTKRDTDIINWHEKQIKDETKFIDGIKKNYKRALEEAAVYAKGKNDLAATAMGVDLRSMSRSANHASDQMRSLYGEHAKQAKTEADYKQDARDRLYGQRDAKRTTTKLELALQQAERAYPSAFDNARKNAAYEQDFNNLLIEDGIASGELPGVTGPYNTYTNIGENNVGVVDPQMDSNEFTTAMVNPRVVDPSAIPTEQVVSAFNFGQLDNLNRRQEYNQDTYGNLTADNRRTSSPTSNAYGAQVQAVKDSNRRQQLLGALQAWKANDAANTKKVVEDTKQARELANLWHRLDANEQAPVAAAQKQQVVAWIKGVLNQVPVLRDVTKVVHESEINTLPDHVQQEYAKNSDVPGIIDLKNSTIYLFANNIHDARTATRTVVHEGVAHFGLRAIMNPDQLENFFRMVYKGAQGEDRWDVIKEKYSDYNMYGMAEEYIADIAERVHLSKVDMPSARRAWTKVYYFLRDLLTKIGWINVTKEDIDRVVLATVYHLVNMDPDAIKRNVAAHAEYNAQAAMGIKYDGFYSPLIKHIENININPNKQMPSKYWVDQIWPRGELRQGLSEEEMQYFDDMAKVRGVFDTFKDMLSATNEFPTMSKSELVSLINDYNDIELQEEVIGSTVNQDIIDNAEAVATSAHADFVNTFNNADSDTRHAFKSLFTEFSNAMEKAGAQPKYTALFSDILGGYGSAVDIKKLARALADTPAPGEFANSIWSMWSGIHQLKEKASPEVLALSKKLNTDLRIYVDAQSALENIGSMANEDIPFGQPPYATKGATNNRNFAFTANIKEFGAHDIGQDRVKHTVFHIRTSDYTDDQGRKVLHIEEIQSDRIQKGLEIDKKTKLPERGFAGIVPKDYTGIRAKAVTKFNSILSAFNTFNGVTADDGGFDHFDLHNERGDLRSEAEIRGMMLRTLDFPESSMHGRSYNDKMAVVEEWVPQIMEAGKALRKAEQDERTIGRSEVPWTPLVKSYPMLALKRMLKFAAENGYEKISWTPGIEQVDRYTDDLRARVESISWSKAPKIKSIDKVSMEDLLKSTDPNDRANADYARSRADKDYMYVATDVNGNKVGYSWESENALIDMLVEQHKHTVSAVIKGTGEIKEFPIYGDSVLYNGERHPMEDLFGKNIANQIMEQDTGHIANDELTIGGKGFTQFYDNELVNNANKYIKKLDSTQKVYDTPFAGYNMHSFNVTDEMRDRLSSEQPTYGMALTRASRPDTALPGDWKNVRKTPAYEKKFGFFKDLKDSFKRTSYSIDANGKILPGSKLTRGEQLFAGLHDSFDRVGRVVHMLHGELRKKGSKITMDENAYEIEKTSHNRIAVAVGDFLVNVLGLDPSNWAHTPGEGTIFNVMAQLIGTNPNIPKDPKELLHVTGKVLQAMHAEEANAELVRKQYKSVVMQSILAETETLEKELANGVSTDRAAKIEKELAKLYEKANIVSSDIRTDLSGMSNAEAKAIMDKYITPNNIKTWEAISQRVQGINKQFLDTAVANHMLSPEMRAHWDALYKNYVPLDVWEAHMKKVDPGFASMGRTFDMGMFELSKERKGNKGVETNPIVLLARKHTQLLQAVEQARVGTSLLEMFNNHPEYLSELIEKDNSGDARIYSSQIKELLAKADSLMGGKNVASTKEAIKGLNKRIGELVIEKNKATLQARAAKSEDTKAKFRDKAQKAALDIQSARDAIETLKNNLEEIKANPEYKSIQQQINDLRKARLKNWNERGYKVEMRNGMTYKVRKSSKFEGRSAEIITVFDKEGNKVRLLIKDPYLLAAFKGTSMINPGPVVRFLGYLQRQIAQLMTTYAPPFIAVNWVRDTTTAMIHMRNVAEDIRDLHWTGDQANAAFMKNVFGTGGKSAFKAALEFERNNGKISDPRMAKMMALYRKHGGYTSMYGMSTYEATQKNMERALKISTTKSNGRELLFATANMMQDISSAVENSTRLAAFTAIHEALVANGVSEEKAASRAATAALDLTVNFTKRGNWSPILSSLFLFSQASINSSVRIAKAMFPESDKGKPIYKKRITKYATGLAAFGFMAALAAKAMGGTDDDGVDFYDKLPEYVRSTNLVIAVGRNRFIRIPVTFGYQAFVAIGNSTADIFTGRATVGKVASNIFGSVMENFSFIGGGSEGVAMFTPTLFKPLVQVYANQNYFGGKVYPEAGSWKKGEQPDSQKYWSSTSELSKKAALWLNMLGGGSVDRKATLLPAITDLSPASIEHVFKQYTGGVGQFLLGIVGVSEKLALGHTEKLSMDQLPIASRFMSHVDNSATMSEYSRIKTELETQINEYKRAKASRVSAGEMAATLNDTRAGRLLEHKMDSIQNKLSDMKADLNKLELAKGATAEDVYKKRIANEEKSAILVKQLIRQAHVAGVK